MYKNKIYKIFIYKLKNKTNKFLYIEYVNIFFFLYALIMCFIILYYLMLDLLFLNVFNNV